MKLYGALLTLVFLFPGVAMGNDGGENGVIIGVSNVSFPSRLPGFCQVKGTVSEVLDGKAFREGQPISLQVPCGTYSRPRPLLPATDRHSAQLIDPVVLTGTRLAGAHIDDAGKLLWEPTRPYPHWGALWGLRIFEAVQQNKNRT